MEKVTIKLFFDVAKLTKEAAWTFMLWRLMSDVFSMLDGTKTATNNYLIIVFFNTIVLLSKISLILFFVLSVIVFFVGLINFIDDCSRRI